MTKYLNNRLTQTATALVVLTVIVFGSFITTTKAEASTSASVATETFPLLVSGAKLALSAVIEQSKPGALVSATVASDQKIAELITRLNELMAIYKSLVAQKGTDSAVNPSNVSDDADVSIRPAYYLQVLSPNGGETYINGGYGHATNLSPEIDIKYKASGIVGEKLVVYLYSPEDGNILTFARTAADSDSIKINIAKGDTLVIPGDYKIILCVPERNLPDSDKTLCDASDNYFKVVGDPGTISSVPHITKIKPESVTPGSRVDVYGTNLYGNPIAIDGVFGTYGIQYPDTLGKSFSFIVPETLSAGKHTLYIEQKISGVPGNSVKFSVSGPVSPTTPTLKVLTPNGGESYIAGESLITIKYKSSNISGQVITAYLYHPEDGNVRTLKGYAANSGELQMYLAKGDSIDKVGEYKITLCAHDAEPSNGKDLCDSSDSYFKLITKVNPDIDPPIEFPLPPVETKNSESSKTQSRY